MALVFFAVFSRPECTRPTVLFNVSMIYAGRPTNDAGVPVECDFGFVGGARGLCVPFGASGDAPAPPASCGGGGQPVCAGADLEGVPSVHFAMQVAALSVQVSHALYSEDVVIVTNFFNQLVEL